MVLRRVHHTMQFLYRKDELHYSDTALLSE